MEERMDEMVIGKFSRTKGLINWVYRKREASIIIIIIIAKMYQMPTMY